MNRATLMTCLFLTALLVLRPSRIVLSADPVSHLDPRAWGSDHVGRAIPEFLAGDQCLFCHRNDVGPSWAKNRHARTVRIADHDSTAMNALLRYSEIAGVAGEVEYVMGNARRQRFLKSGEEQGRLDVLTAEWSPSDGDDRGRLIHADDVHWDAKLFGDSCAGCHATAVDAATRRFEAISLDCFVCHGDVPAEHTEQPQLARFSGGWQGTPREEMSVCGQCHLRGGRSKSSGLPYPNNFVPGDNLFLDFDVDLSDEALARADPAEGHILETVRHVVLSGQDEVTCLSCHAVHAQSTRRHRRLGRSQVCLHCHHADRPKRQLKSFAPHSTTCGY